MNNTYKTKKSFIKKLVVFIEGMSKYSMRILNITLPIICIVFMVLLFMMIEDAKICAPAALDRYPRLIEYISRSLVVAIGGALALDIIDKRNSHGK